MIWSGFGSCHVSLFLHHVVTLYASCGVPFSQLVWRIGIWVTELELCSVDSDSSGLCSVDSESLWLVIMPKSKDWFVERPPMKTGKTMSLYGYDLA
jgi:hypothetical protein